jgi:hypothetical protein
VEDCPNVASTEAEGVITTVRTSPVTVVTLVYTSVGAGDELVAGAEEEVTSEDEDEGELVEAACDSVSRCT